MGGGGERGKAYLPREFKVRRNKIKDKVINLRSWVVQGRTQESILGGASFCMAKGPKSYSKIYSFLQETVLKLPFSAHTPVSASGLPQGAVYISSKSLVFFTI